MTEKEIIALIEQYAASAGVETSTFCERAVGNSRLYNRLVAGGSCSLKTINRLRDYGDKISEAAG
jgi:hypothetical protein